MKKLIVYNLILLASISHVFGVQREELQEKVLPTYMGNYTFLEEKEISFNNFPLLSIFVYRLPEKKYTFSDLWEFSRQESDGNYTLLLPANLKLMGVPPALYHVNINEDETGVDIALLAKFDGTAMIWSKNVYRYTGDTLELKETFWGYEDAPHADPVTGKGVRTPPTWWDPDGVPMTSQAARLKQDEEGNTWRLVADEVVEEDTASASKKAILYRKDLETGYWWKNLGK